MNQERHALSNPGRWVELHGDALYRYALSRLLDPIAAEDAVQETFLAALEASGSYTGAAAERTWMITILRSKIIDHIRARRRCSTAGQLAEGTEAMFDEKGIWLRVPGLWPKDPSAPALAREFQEVLHGCLSKMPKSLAQTFLLRELDGLSTEELCQVLEITPNNLWTRLHRARLALRQCLEENWFGRSDSKCT